MLVSARRTLRPHGAPLARLFATATSHLGDTPSSRTPELLPGTSRRQKKSGTIEGVFGGLKGEPVVLPERFAALKRQICKDPKLFEARWRSVLRELEKEVELIAQKGSEVSLGTWAMAGLDKCTNNVLARVMGMALGPL